MKPRVKSISTMLSYKRPHKSYTERQFIQKYLKPLGMQQDSAGNLYKRIGDAPIMYSCHTDTVHYIPGFHNMVYCGDTLMLDPKEVSACLGADDGAGVWLMREMILAKKPGLYVFHRAEERGCKGSKWIAKQNKGLVKDIMAVIAFDRRGTKSIITHQFPGRTCSRVFAESLGRALGMGHEPDPTGSVTDSAQYIDLVGECTNVSIGYQNEHSNNETLDMRYLTDLRESMLDFDWTKLAFSRKAGDREPRYGWWKEKNKDKSNGTTAWDEYWAAASNYDKPYQRHLPLVPRDKVIIPSETDTKRFSSLSGAGYIDPEESKEERDDALILKMVKDNPEEVVLLLKDYGLDGHKVADFLFAHGATVPTEFFGGYGNEEGEAV